MGALVAVLLAGCTQFNLRENLTLWKTEPQPQRPTRIVAFWTDEVLTQPGKPSVRGFAGRVMFYKDQNGKPVPVDGTITIFAFDDADRDNGYTAPEKRYVYLPEQMRKYYSESDLGPSYSFWLPWGEVGGAERRLCLVARFEPRDGAPIVSTPCRKLLPGTPPPPGELGTHRMHMTKTTPSPVQQAAYNATPQRLPQDSTATTITIDVPPSFARRSLELPGPANDTAREASSRTGPLAVVAATGNRPNRSEPAAAVSTERRAGEAPAPSVSAAGPADRYARPRFPARREPSMRPKPDPVRRQPHPSTWPPSLPPTPRSDWPGAAPESSPTDESPLR